MRLLSASLLASLLLSGCGDPITGGNTGKDTADTHGSSPPTLTVTVAEVDFGDLAYGELASQPLTITNTGEEALEITAITLDSPFRVSPDHLTVQPSSTAQLTLSVQLADYDDHEATLSATTNDPALPTFTLAVRATPIRDTDADGYEIVAAGGDDCDDNDATVHPGAGETWYDGIDQDCDGTNDYDQDGDGYEAETDSHHPAEPDCSDVRVDYHPGAEDPPYDGDDTNCDGADDYDVDLDGERATPWGDDCDDADAAVNPDAAEVIDGLDNNCDGTPDDDGAFLDAPYAYESAGRYDRVGTATALADLDQDGYADLIVAASYAGATSPSDTGDGALAIFKGGATLAADGTRTDDADAYVDGAAGVCFGTALAVLGDWEGDGVTDLVAQAANAEDGAGGVYVLSGTSALEGRGLSSALLSIEGQSGESFGGGLGTRLDLDGDGLEDLVATYTASAHGGVAVEYGGGSGVITTDDIAARWLTDNGTLHQGGIIGADLDADGLDDLVMGAPGTTVDSLTNAGAVYVLYGASTRYAAAETTLSAGDWTVALTGSARDDGVGTTVQTAPDWDENGHDELWVYDDASGVYVVDGAALTGGDPKHSYTAGWTWSASTSDAALLARVGDWDGDGLVDMGAWFDHGSGELAFFGSTRRSGLETWSNDRLAWVTGSSLDGNSSAGQGIAAEGADVDGDGDDDVLTGDPGFDNNAGEAYLFLQR